MKKGDIALFHGEGIFEKLIQRFSHSRWNHAAVVSDVNAVGPIIIEATQKGLVTTQLKMGVDPSVISYRDPGFSDPDSVTIALNWARKKAAEKIKYNFWDIAMIGIHLFFRGWNIAFINDQYFCSEFCGEYLEHGGNDLKVDPIFVSPGDLDTICPVLSE